MSLLATATTGPSLSGSRMVISGVEGVGKTTLACQAPRSLLIPLEQGALAVQTPKIPRLIASFSEVMTLLTDIGNTAQAGKLPYKSLVFDSATALERLIHAHVLTLDPQYGRKKDLNMETALGGFGKAYAQANILFNEFTNLCDALSMHFGLNIILTCHVFASKVLDPAYGEYYTWDMQLHSPKNERTYGKRELITQWADLVGLLHEPMFVTKNEGDAAARAISANQGRVLGVERTPAYVAKNRYDLNGLIPIPREKGWNNLAHAIYTAKGIDLYNRDI